MVFLFQLPSFQFNLSFLQLHAHHPYTTFKKKMKLFLDFQTHKKMYSFLVQKAKRKGYFFPKIFSHDNSFYCCSLIGCIAANSEMGIIIRREIATSLIASFNLDSLGLYKAWLLKLHFIASEHFLLARHKYCATALVTGT